MSARDIVVSVSARDIVVLVSARDIVFPVSARDIVPLSARDIVVLSTLMTLSLSVLVTSSLSVLVRLSLSVLVTLLSLSVLVTLSLSARDIVVPTPANGGARRKSASAAGSNGNSGTADHYFLLQFVSYSFHAMYLLIHYNKIVLCVLAYRQTYLFRYQLRCLFSSDVDF